MASSLHIFIPSGWEEFLDRISPPGCSPSMGVFLFFPIKTAALADLSLLMVERSLDLFYLSSLVWIISFCSLVFTPCTQSSGYWGVNYIQELLNRTTT